MNARLAVLGLVVSLSGCVGGPLEPDEDGGVVTDDAGAPSGDAGMDAGVAVDAGVPDAGTTIEDAGVDAGLPEVDAGNPWEGVHPLQDAGVVERIDGGFQFIEGPQWVPSLGALLFSDIPANRVWQFTPPATFTVFLSPSGNANGLALQPDGGLLLCQHEGRVSQWSPTGLTPVVDQFEGKTLNSPNDAIVRRDGTLYFTDPSYGGVGQVGTRGAYRRGVDGGVTRFFETTQGQPNGITLSPDETVLYLSDSQLAEVHRFELSADGTPGNRTRFASTGGGGDGITVDVNGNLYVTTSSGVKIYAPDAGLLGVIAVPQEPANCAFGDPDGRTLYITARTGLYRVRLAVPGTP